MTRDIFYRESGSYRFAVDKAGIGSVRVLKRVNFKTFIRRVTEHGIQRQEES
ncbi:hypothetical protein [Methanocella arvoryzae]|uniref:hypothetical protein n=1 Tax=Methanocella arvoryzae TaxID=1175445 RepID=UPI0003261383|nr:hypothetical protein [Methanocella arvoryzae]